MESFEGSVGGLTGAFNFVHCCFHQDVTAGVAEAFY
jgi:hypothetical protein